MYEFLINLTTAIDYRCILLYNITINFILRRSYTMKISKSSILSIIELIVEKTQFKSEGVVEGCIEYNALSVNRVDISEIFNSVNRFTVDEIKSTLFILSTLGLIGFESTDDKTYKSVTLTERGYSFYLDSLLTNLD